MAWFRQGLLVLFSVALTVGNWQGGYAAVDAPTVARQVIAHLTAHNYAAATAMFDATMQQALPATQLQQAWQGLLTQAGSFQRVVDVHTEPAGQLQVVLAACQFEDAMIDLQVVMNEAGQVAGLRFLPHQAAVPYVAPPYVKPQTFRSEEVTIGTGEWQLPGTLTMPNGEGPFPAVVLVHGSGPNDRDETLGPNKPFRDLAEGLSSRGVAVLRYDKRTKVYGVRMATDMQVTVKTESIDDAVSAAALLRTTEGIDPKRVFVLGHSLGGMLAPRIGKADPTLAGLIVLAGAARPLEDAILQQMTYIFSLDGTVSPEERAQLEEIKRQAERIKAPGLSPAAGMLLNAPAAYWLDLRGYHPPQAAKELGIPMLILQGGRDYQVTTAEFDAWKTALAGRQDVTCTLYPNLNHLFIAGAGVATPQEYAQPGHVDEAVVKDIAAWVAVH